MEGPFRTARTSRSHALHDAIRSGPRRLLEGAARNLCRIDDGRTSQNRRTHQSRETIKERHMFRVLISLFLVTVSMTAQAPQRPATRADVLRGEYGRYRANNDLLFYHLDIRVDPEKKFISGRNTIRFRMLKDDTRVQIDLAPNLNVDRILLGTSTLKYERELSAVFVDFPEMLKTGRVVTIDFYYSGVPQETGRFGGMTFKKDSSGHHWINTACEESGASVWWPNKDQWRDEVERMELSVSIPNGLTDASNGKFVGKTDLGDGYTRWDWLIQYPINSYGVS